jgi:hypothetical protein
MGRMAPADPSAHRTVKVAHPYPGGIRDSLDRLLDDVASGTIGPLPAGAWDHDAWTAWAAPYIGTSWQDAPFLWSESYFYRQLLEATGFFEPGPWQRVDPFARMKAAGL